ncbi:unnamed protein product [Caenorhabditis angaria]|uniref:Serpentine Receptor, class E (Epsilon) n=1 Tax=Caenorhabditis angaria TaxID=860376 RepID=A0A9P1IDJ0_9PELO|nr:unnamed protein product [Caenorhabditis angaria]
MDTFLSPLPFISYNFESANFTFKIPIYIELEQPLDSMLMIIFCMEFLALIPSMIIMSYFIWIIYSISLVHRNISILILVALINFNISGISRFYILLVQLKLIQEHPLALLIASLFRIEFYGCAIAGFPITAIERFFATYYLGDYESSNRHWILYALIPLLIISPQPLVYLTLLTDYPLIFPLGVSGIAIFGSQIFFNILYRFNENERLRIKQNPMMYTLGKKFQLEENLHVMWILRAVGHILIFLALILIIILVFPWQTLLGFENYTEFYCAVDLVIALSSLFLPIVMGRLLYVKRNPGFLRKIQWMFGNSRKPTVSTVKSVMRDETSVYFRQFDMSWK